MVILQHHVLKNVKKIDYAALKKYNKNKYLRDPSNFLILLHNLFFKKMLTRCKHVVFLFKKSLHCAVFVLY